MNPEALTTLENCRYCLMCRHADPLGHVTHLETLTPHGIALTAVSQQRGLIDWDDEMVGVIYSEVDAGVARAHCVTDQPFSEAIALVKADLVSAGLAPPSVSELDDTRSTALVAALPPGQTLVTSAIELPAGARVDSTVRLENSEERAARDG